MTDFEYEIKDLETMSVADNYHRWVLSEFKGFVGKEVLEVGAGIGNFSRLLLETPGLKKLTSVEPDKAVCSIYQKKISDPRAEIINGFFGEVNDRIGSNFDSIFYINVLEHVENDKKELERVHKNLKTGGRVCVFVPALQWLYSDHDRAIGHVRRYQKKQLRKLLEQAGFKVEKIKYFDIFGILTWFIAFKVFKREPNSGDMSLYDKLVIPVLRFAEKIIPPPIGKNLVAIGRKI